MRLELELSITPRWAWALVFGLWLASPRLAGTGETYTLASPPIYTGQHEALLSTGPTSLGSRAGGVGRTVLFANATVSSLGGVTIGGTDVQAAENLSAAPARAPTAVGSPAWGPAAHMAPVVSVGGNVQVTGCILLPRTAKCHYTTF
ncbi:MAG: hypothetical protein HY554_04040 [Elusimicrobia bacterium]|nr:hypothetical protein [Elusimicrobiota bacterium]